jgi:flagellar biosynthesis/type III secretory pathway protein FliH
VTTPKFSKAKKVRGDLVLPPVPEPPKVDPWAAQRTRELTSEERAFQNLWSFLESFTGRSMELHEVEKFHNDIACKVLGDYCSESEIDERIAEAEERAREEGIEEGAEQASEEGYKRGRSEGARQAVEYFISCLRESLPDRTDEVEYKEGAILVMMRNIRAGLDKMGDEVVRNTAR